MTMFAQILLGVQLLLAAYFCFFGFYNYFYGITCFIKPKLKKVEPSQKKVAVVIVSYNEKEVIASTIKACERLTYRNKVIIVGDDSNDDGTFPLLKHIAKQRKCKQLHGTAFIDHGRTEVWESKDFVLFHRHDYGKHPYKGGHLKELEAYLKARGFDYMYLLDADWWPQHDTIERCMEVIEADDRLAFVQTRKHSYHDERSFLQRCLAMNEDASSVVELAGRQAVGDPILFGGCSALFRLGHLYAAEGFRAGHLTEDMDITNRFYLLGYKGAYLDSVADEGEVPPHYHAYRKQQEHWAAGCARTLRDYLWPIIRSDKLSWGEKLGLLRQNAFYTNAVAINASIVLALATVLFMVFAADSFEAMLYRYYLEEIAMPYTAVMFAALGSNLVPLVVTVLKRRKHVNLLFIPYAMWASWSVLHTYFGANVQGFFHDRFSLDWFHTPKTNKQQVKLSHKKQHHISLLNALTLAALLWMYWLEWQHLGWLDVYAFFWVPALAVGMFLS